MNKFQELSVITKMSYRDLLSSIPSYRIIFVNKIYNETTVDADSITQ